MRILLFGDGAWATRSLLCLQQSKRWQVVGLVLRVQPSEETLEQAARDLSIPILQPQKVNESESIEQVKALAPDLNLSISYNQILGLPMLESAPLGFVNFHAGKLPFYRGRNVINWAILNGEKEIGLTAHFVDEGIDTGDIILQTTIPILWTDTYGDVLSRIVEYFPSIVTQTVERLANGDYKRQPQDIAGGTYFAGRDTGDEWLDWKDTSFNLHNKIRAISRPGPGARTTLYEQEVIVWRAFHDPSSPKYLATPGQVVGRNQDGVLVKTGDSTLYVKEVQFQNSSSITPRWPIGTRLGTDAAAILSAVFGRLKLIGF
ncbi:MAG TPA: methionyl-tRNA formyltransferase [Pyrinomonadaceae bacterium]|nr:methionyl-tRNA formyltransferase [Pyrinomonadaceae bacterium]